MKKKLDTNDCNFGHLTMILLPRSPVKCWSGSLAVYNSEFLLRSACVSSENYRDHKIIENPLLHLLFKIIRHRTEM